MNPSETSYSGTVTFLKAPALLFFRDYLRYSPQGVCDFTWLPDAANDDVKVYAQLLQRQPTLKQRNEEYFLKTKGPNDVWSRINAGWCCFLYTQYRLIAYGQYQHKEYEADSDDNSEAPPVHNTAARLVIRGCKSLTSESVLYFISR